jgi:hypothetical protein
MTCKTHGQLRCMQAHARRRRCRQQPTSCCAPRRRRAGTLARGPSTSSCCARAWRAWSPAAAPRCLSPCYAAACKPAPCAGRLTGGSNNPRSYFCTQQCISVPAPQATTMHKQRLRLVHTSDNVWHRAVGLLFLGWPTLLLLLAGRLAPAPRRWISCRPPRRPPVARTRACGSMGTPGRTATTRRRNLAHRGHAVSVYSLNQGQRRVQHRLT